MQPILNIKKQMEDNLKNGLAKAIGRLEKERAALLRIEIDQNEHSKNFIDMSSNGTNVINLRA